MLHLYQFVLAANEDEYLREGQYLGECIVELCSSSWDERNRDWEHCHMFHCFRKVFIKL
jgi:hypothetical protein